MIFFGILTFALFCLSQANEIEECLPISLKITRANEDDYARATGSLPEMTQTSICFWADVNSLGKLSGAVFSYATESESNDIILDRDDFGYAGRLYGYGELAPTGRHHLCLTFSIVDHAYTDLGVYIDGLLSFEERYYSDSGLSRVEPDGIMIFGQDQDGNFGSIENNFDSSQTYTGSIGNFALWDRILSPTEIEDMYMGTCTTDAIFKFTKRNIQIYGAAAIVDYED